MSKSKSSAIEHPVSAIIRDRKSVRAFSPVAIEEEKVRSLFEATRWAPSSTNEQPWLYRYAMRDQPELWQRFFEPLNEGNKVWARQAPMLVFSVARKSFSRFEAANTYALYDLGAANSLLSLQAVELGLQVRQMAGYDRAMAKSLLRISDDYEPGVFMAVGYPGPADHLPKNLQERETAPRERFLQHEFVRNGIF